MTTTSPPLNAPLPHARRIAVNFSSLLVSQTLSKLIGLAASILIARHLGPRLFGTYAFSFAFVGLFAVVSDAGIERLLVREVARTPEETGRILVNGLALDSIMCAVAFVGAAGLIHLFGYSSETNALVALVACYLVISSWNTVLAAILRGHQRMEVEAAIVLAERLATVVAVIVAIRMGAHPAGIVLCLLMTIIGKFVLLFVATRLCLGWQMQRPDRSTVVALGRALMPFVASSAFGVLYFRIDSVMLRVMRGESSVGMYASAYRFLEGLLFFATLVPLVLYPVLTRVFATGESDRFREWTARLLDWSVFFVTPIASLLAALATQIMLMSYDNEFAPAAAALHLLAWTLIPLTMHHSLARTLDAMQCARLTAYATGAMLGVNIVLNLVLIPSFDFMGSAAATLATELFAVAILLGLISKQSVQVVPVDALMKSIAGGLACYLLARFVGVYSLVASVILGCAAYVFVLWITKAVRSEDIAMLRSVIGYRLESDPVSS